MMWNHRPIIIRIKRHENVHPFIQALHGQKIELKHVMFRDQEVTFETNMAQLSKIRRTRKRYKLKMTVHYADEMQVFRAQLWTVLGLIIMIIIPLLCAQVVWRIDVEADSPELRQQIEKTFHETFQLEAPIAKKKVPSATMIRQELLEKHRELAWVHIEKNGGRVVTTTTGITKANRAKNERLATHLVAAKSGVITNFNIKHGERKISVNDTAYDGDVLVTGVIDSGEDKVFVGARGRSVCGLLARVYI